MTSQALNRPVDVLRVLDAEIMSLTMLSGRYAAEPLIETRAAVAELIAAAHMSCNVDRVTDGLREALAAIGSQP